MAHTYNSNKNTLARARSSSGRDITITTPSGCTLICLGIAVDGLTARTGGAPTVTGGGTGTFLQADSNRSYASGETISELWYLIDPPIGALTVHIPDDNNMYFSADIASYSAGSGKTSSLKTANGASGSSTNPTGPSLTGLVAGDLIFATVGDGATTWSPTGRTGVQLYDVDDGAWGHGSQHFICTGTGNIAMAWTYGSSFTWSLVEAAFTEVTAPKLFPGRTNIVSVTSGPVLSNERRLVWDADVVSVTSAPALGINIIDQYTGYDALWQLYSGVRLGAGQSFTGNGQAASSVTVKLEKTGAPTGLIYARIYAHSGTFGTSSIPTGSPIASGSIDCSAIGVVADKEIYFTTQPVLQDGVRYVLAIEYSGGSSGNTINIGLRSSSPTHPGNYSDSSDLSTWYPSSTMDLYFILESPMVRLMAGEADINVSTGPTTAIIDQNTTVDNSDDLRVDYRWGRGQSMTGDGRTIGAVGFSLQRVGNPPGNAVAKLYAHTGTFGGGGTCTGAALATSQPIPASTIQTGSYAEIIFYFITPYMLTNGTKYCVAVEYNAVGSNSSNRLVMQVSNSNVHAGNEVEMDTNGTWLGWASVDVYFNAYNVGPVLDIATGGGTTYNLSGVAALASTTPTPALLLERDLAGIAALASVTSGPALLLLKALAGVAAGTTVTSTTALLLLKALAGAAAGVSVTSGPALLLLKALAGAAAGVSVTSGPALLLLKALAGAAAIQSITSTPALDGIGGIYNLSGIAAMAAATSTPVANVLRLLAGASAAQAVTATPVLSLLIPMSGAAAIGSVTPNTVPLLLLKALGIVGPAAISTATPTPALLLLKALAGIAAGTSVTPAVAALLERDLAGIAAMAAATSTPALYQAMTMAGLAAIQSTVSTPTLSIQGIYNPAGVAAIVTATAAPVLNMLRNLGVVAPAAMVSTTPTPALLLLKALAGIAAPTSVTSGPALLMLRALPGAAAIQSTVSAPILSISGLYTLAGVAAIQAATPNVSLGVLRSLVGAAAIGSTTPTPALLLLKALAGTAAMNTTTSAGVLKILRVLAGRADISTLTPDQVVILLAGLHAILGAATTTIALKDQTVLTESGLNVIADQEGIGNLGTTNGLHIIPVKTGDMTTIISKK
jgi:hypothetical protein